MDRTEQPTSDQLVSEQRQAEQDQAAPAAPVEIVEELVEEISIDGMCGVY
ncbi:MAG: mycofactocin precursor MftA [Actinomycetota bacterium]|nr:mycofactocin precursor MftA [Actinomycetota bacterium]MDA2974393.1 mycofactocin precursor MftA [Actinomycetota bacterium]MDA3009897.1 mycofactocin precursor MftA [Actinomycetota bacterium]